MTQVSRFLIRDDVWQRIFDLFVDTLVRVKEKRKLEGFIEGFFTPTEKIMFAKRLAAAVMLAKETDYRTIRRTLRISPPTIARMSMRIKYDNQGIRPVINDILKRHAALILLNEMVELLDFSGKGKNMVGVGKRKYKREMKRQELKKEF